MINILTAESRTYQEIKFTQNKLPVVPNFKRSNVNMKRFQLENFQFRN